MSIRVLAITCTISCYRNIDWCVLDACGIRPRCLYQSAAICVLTAQTRGDELHWLGVQSPLAHVFGQQCLLAAWKHSLHSRSASEPAGVCACWMRGHLRSAASAWDDMRRLSLLWAPVIFNRACPE